MFLVLTHIHPIDNICLALLLCAFSSLCSKNTTVTSLRKLKPTQLENVSFRASSAGDSDYCIFF